MYIVCKIISTGSCINIGGYACIKGNNVSMIVIIAFTGDIKFIVDELKRVRDEIFEWSFYYIGVDFLITKHWVHCLLKIVLVGVVFVFVVYTSFMVVRN